MVTSEIQPELDALVATATEAAKAALSAATRKRFAVAINQLTATFRTLRADTARLPSSAVSDFLLRTVPRALAVFNASLCTYELNQEVCRQIVVFLGLLNSVPPPKHASTSINNALRNLHDAACHCFFALASRGQHDDVRPLLNALLLVAAGAANPIRQRSSLARLSNIATLGWQSGPLQDDHFVNMLRTLLTGWVAATTAVGQWSAVKYLDIADGVSIALSIRVEKHASRRDLQAVISGLRKLTHPPSSSAKGGPEDVIRLAFASGILQSLETSVLRESYGLKEELSNLIRTILTEKESSLRGFAGRESLDEMTSADNETLSLAFLVFRVARSLCDRLSADQLAVLRTVLELLVKSGGRMDRKNNSEVPLVHRQLLWCVNSYSVMLGQAYASFVGKEKRQAECVHFLQSLISENTTNEAVNRFVLTTALNCESTPTIAVALVDLLSFIPSRTASILEVLARKLVPVIAQDTAAISSVCGLLMALLDANTSPAGHVRVSFLLAVVRLAVADRSRNLEQLPRGGAEPGDEEEHDNLWVPFVDAVQVSLLRKRGDERYVGGCLDLLKEVLRSAEPSLKHARTELTTRLPAVLVKKYVFAGDSATERGRLMQTASVLDAVAETTVDCDLAERCLDGMISGSSGLNEQQTRMVGVLLLRFMGRCRLEVFEVALAGVEKLIGEDEKRKLGFLPLSRVAVLGTDMLRKNWAVEWLLDFFAEVSGTQIGSDVRSGKAVQAKL